MSFAGSHPLLSRNGEHVFFERRTMEGFEIARKPIDSDTIFSVHSSGHDITIRDVDDDGSQIIFSTRRSSGGMAVVEESNVLDTRTLEVTSLGVGVGGCFVENGDIVYSLPRSREVMYKSKDGHSRRICSGGFPSSSADGRRVLYVKNPNDPVKERLWEVYDLQSQKIFSVGKAFGPVLSADGTSVVFLSPENDWSVWKYEVKTKSRKRLGQLDAPIASFSSTEGGVTAMSMGAPLRVVIIDAKKNTIRQIPANGTLSTISVGP